MTSNPDMSNARLTELQRKVLARCLHAADTGTWYRAASSGERVTLASLCRIGLAERRVWRGREGEPDAAHEYRASKVVREEWDRLCKAAVRAMQDDR